MKSVFDENLEYVKAELERERSYRHAEEILEFDKLTMCPPAGMQRQEEAKQRISSHKFSIRKDPEFIRRVEALYENLEEADPLDAILIKRLYRDGVQERDISKELHERIGAVSGHLWEQYEKARSEGNADVYLTALKDWIAVQKERVSQLRRMPGEEELTIYERMLGNYDRGVRTARMDELFAESTRRARDLFQRIRENGKAIRTDFLYRETTAEQQKEMAKYLMELVGFDFRRGKLAQASYPFASLIAEDDVRIAIREGESQFLANIFSVLHECGYALFEHLQPREDYAHFITEEKSQAMRESISRFYANIVGRSREFMELIYPKLCEIYPKVMRDVTSEELYEAVNCVNAGVYRAEADELTYLLHVAIRYELEKELIGGDLDVSLLREKWNEKYREYLGITPKNDLEGILQEIHWNLGFGYYPAYNLGNYCSGMILNRMKEDFDPMETIARGDFAKINEWLRVHAFSVGNRMDLGDWIRSVTGKRLCVDDFLQYLEKKLSDVYDLNQAGTVERQLTDYVRRTYRIRKLSSPLLDDLKSAEDYSVLLNENFREIGRLSSQNKLMISTLIDPVVKSEDALPEESVRRIMSFSEKLLDNENERRLDVPVVSLLAGRLRRDAESKDDVAYYVTMLDAEIKNCVGLIEQTCTITACREIADGFFEKGMAAFRECMKLLEDKEAFLRLDDKSRRTLVSLSAFGSALYRHAGMDTGYEKNMWERLKVIEHALRLADDPFYREALPGYDWERHKVFC